MKICTRCKEPHEDHEFYKNRTKNDGLQVMCKCCIREVMRLNNCKKKQPIYDQVIRLLATHGAMSSDALSQHLGYATAQSASNIASLLYRRGQIFMTRVSARLRLWHLEPELPAREPKPKKEPKPKVVETPLDVEHKQWVQLFSAKKAAIMACRARV